MKILFLDVDGVLNRCTDWRLLTTPCGDMAAPFIVELNHVLLLNETLLRHAPEVGIVVSSSWRAAFENAADFCKATHVEPSLIHEDWRTPSGAGGSSGPKYDTTRPFDVAAWLDRHPEVTEFCAIDDTAYAFNRQFGKQCFVRTKSQEGLTALAMRDVMCCLGYEGYEVEHRALTYTAPDAT